MTKDTKYEKIYLQESEELLLQMNQNLLVFEKDPGDKEALNAIFRSAHTLKSMAASMGFRPISDLAHKMEDLLEQIRNGAVEINEKNTDLLFKSFDLLEKMTDEVRKGKEMSANISPLILELDSVMPQKARVREEAVSSNLVLNEFEKRTLARVKKDGYYSYHVTVMLEKNCVLKSVRAFMVFRNLHPIGEVIRSFPDSLSIEEERFEDVFSCVFITKEDAGRVKKYAMEVMDVKSVNVDLINVDESWDKINYSEAVEAVAKDVTAPISEHIKKMQSVRVDISVLDKLMNLVEELAICRLGFADLSVSAANVSLKSSVEQLGRLTDELQNEVMKARLIPVGQIFERFPRLVRDLAKKEDKKVKFDMLGADIELDRTVLDEIGEPLIHILKNSIDHGIELPGERKKNGKPEDGRIMLSARREKSYVFIVVEDDGKGMDVDEIKRAAILKNIISEESARTMSVQDVLLLTTTPGFSTKKDVSEVSGRGVGMDVARKKAESLGGSLIIESRPGKGTKVSMRLPITTAVVKALLVKVLGRVFAVPVSSVIEIITVKEGDIKRVEKHETILHRDKVLPIVRMADKFGIKSFDSEPSTPNFKLNVVIVESGDIQFGIVVETLLSQQDVVVKQLTKELRGVKGFAGATIMGDGSVALVMDVATLV